MTMEDISKLLELMQSLGKYLSWSILFPCFFTTAVLLILFRIISIYIILSPMYTTIETTTTIICLLSLFGLLYKGFADLCNFIYTKVKLRKDTLAVQKQIHEEQERIREQIRRLSPQERIVFEYVQNGNSCAVWVGDTDAAVLTLLHKGLLERIGDKACFADWPPNTDERASCILAVIPEAVKKGI